MAAKRRSKVYSGIGGQAVIEGIMMRNGEKYAVAVRRPDGKIEIDAQTHRTFMEGSFLLKIPFVRGMFVFIDSLILGTRALNFSADIYDQEEGKESGTSGNGALDGLLNSLVLIIAVALAIGLFIVLPTYLASVFEKSIRNASLVSVIEGAIRMIVFILYMFGIGFIKDMRRVYRYHGAEHKCINCIERGKTLNVDNVMKSSRFHRRCGTSFMYISVFISIIIFFFIRIEYIPLRIFIRLLLIPVVLGISYEILRLAGKSENFFVYVLTAPGIWFQHLTTKEPDRQMVEVAINSVEAVFDWKKYLADNFGYDIDENGEIAGVLPGWGDDYTGEYYDEEYDEVYDDEAGEYYEDEYSGDDSYDD
ncbi:MAG: DUF1385 domain-containing protein [Lachnospiraceae bacterium]|nr:DUF1385 domain-containing protein [Lachnospiraceae bacterium]